VTIERDKVLAILSDTSTGDLEWARKLGSLHDASKTTEYIETAEWVKEEYGITVTPQEVFEVLYETGSRIDSWTAMIAAWDASHDLGSEMTDFMERMRKR
jgi:hypothetical protein